MGVETRFRIGQRVKDSVTDFEGYITAYMVSHNGTIYYIVEGIDTTGRPIVQWVDECRLMEVDG